MIRYNPAILAKGSRMTLFQRNSLVALALSLASSVTAFGHGGRMTPHDDSYEVSVRFCQKPSELCAETISTLRAYEEASVAAEARLVAEEANLHKELEARNAAIEKMPPGLDKVRARRQALLEFESAQNASLDQMTEALSALSANVAARLRLHPEIARQRTLKRFGFLGAAISRAEHTRLLLQEPGSLQFHLKLANSNVDFIKDCRLKPEDSFHEQDFFQPELGDGSLLVQVAEERGRGLVLKINVDAGIQRKIDNCGEAEPVPE